MTILVTGASGFLGSEVALVASAAGQRVRALVRRTSDTTKLVSRDLELVYGDVTDRDAVRAAVAGADAVIHIAGLVKAKDEASFTRVNGVAAGIVAAEAAAAGVARLLHVSSLAARGPDATLAPVSAYGRSKLAGEISVRAAAGPRMMTTILRPTAIYGPADRELLPSFQLAAKGIRPVLKGGGLLTLLHVRDLAAGLIGLVEADAIAGDTLEVSDGGHYSWHDLVTSIAASVGRPGPVLEVPLMWFRVAATLTDVVAAVTRRPQVFGRDKLEEMRGSWSVDPGPFWRAAGRAPRSLAEGLADTVTSYRTSGWL